MGQTSTWLVPVAALPEGRRRKSLPPCRIMVRWSRRDSAAPGFTVIVPRLFLAPPFDQGDLREAG